MLLAVPGKMHMAELEVTAREEGWNHPGTQVLRLHVCKMPEEKDV